MRKRLVSSCELDAERDRPLYAWHTRWVLSVRVPEASKKGAVQNSVFPMPIKDCPDSSITLYRAHFLKLKEIPKPTRDQLIILLPTEMGLRSGEVASLRIENIDLDQGSALITDSKLHKMVPIPMTYEVAKTYQKLLSEDKRDEGWLILQHERVAWRRGKPITTIGLCYIWHKWARKAEIPDWQQYTPRLGRHFFAAEWAYTKRGSLEVLRRIMRHRSLAYTQLYIENLIFYEDVRAEVQRLQALPQIREGASPCIHFEVCKHAAEGCYCKNFVPVKEVKV